MRKILFLFVLVLAASRLQAQTGPQLVWDNNGKHDFGQVTEGQVVSHTFEFTNKGKEPLILTAVQPTCGCTVPNDWPKDPIPPGGKGKVTVSFNSQGRVGNNTKVIRVISNASNDGSGQFSFTASVVAKKAN